ncbi:bifunctional phosphopantothenoylcysteine decarboxylase/phosphopantothenate--cysteine ligase CoaBC [Hazenella sp. IB182353]|uniref:bifunctional phosphopantothenoylcysteine decarboxylase/phosphopantothenate--cysteine ligase CoaBC n=1 Tax=Polycladospora coralii TaxID=2771432 RepID=UPI0017474AD4|nr:bifunctional phosphopantothenoylcysteine decarboxylase/phosphopantothenate--cysteine ligase CoaBC [Polycladospora coralii]
MMRGKRIVLGISGGIAAYKAATLASQLTQAGADVRVIMTQSATKFITPLTLQILSKHEVAIDTFDEKDPEVVSHIDIADHADLVVIAPATANVIAKLAHGIADDMLSTTCLATTAPVMIAPAMNVHMYDHPTVRQNMDQLQGLGIHFIEPGSGPLACGYVGKGRMAEPEEIMAYIASFFMKKQPLRGKKVLITAGPTIEPVDPVRFFSNHSSGKMGYAIAEVAAEAGAEVTIISGPVPLQTPAGVERFSIQTAEEMKEEVLKRLADSDIIIKAAAVADYRPKVVQTQKIKKNDHELTLTLEKTTDIAAEVGKRKKANQIFVGFAAETNDVEKHAIDKLKRKGMDLIVANDVTLEGAGFGTDTNIVTLYDANGCVKQLPQMTKQKVATELIAVIGERLHD